MYDSEKTRELNDRFRSTLLGGRVMLTQGVASRSDVMQIVALVRQFDTFDEDNDPYCEHDFGSMEVGADRIFWKLDYYDIQLQEGSPDPADPKVTTRVLTIMLAKSIELPPRPLLLSEIRGNYGRVETNRIGIKGRGDTLKFENIYPPLSRLAVGNK